MEGTRESDRVREKEVDPTRKRNKMFLPSQFACVLPHLEVRRVFNYVKPQPWQIATRDASKLSEFFVSFYNPADEIPSNCNGIYVITNFPPRFWRLPRFTIFHDSIFHVSDYIPDFRFIQMDGSFSKFTYGKETPLDNIRAARKRKHKTNITLEELLDRDVDVNSDKFESRNRNNNYNNNNSDDDSDNDDYGSSKRQLIELDSGDTIQIPSQLLKPIITPTTATVEESGSGGGGGGGDGSGDDGGNSTRASPTRDDEEHQQQQQHQQELEERVDESTVLGQQQYPSIVKYNADEFTWEFFNRKEEQSELFRKILQKQQGIDEIREDEIQSSTLLPSHQHQHNQNESRDIVGEPSRHERLNKSKFYNRIMQMNLYDYKNAKQRQEFVMSFMNSKDTFDGIILNYFNQLENIIDEMNRYPLPGDPEPSIEEIQRIREKYNVKAIETKIPVESKKNKKITTISTPFNLPKSCIIDIFEFNDIMKLQRKKIRRQRQAENERLYY